MNQSIELKETELVTTTKVKYLNIKVLDVLLHESALIMYELFDPEKLHIKTATFRLTGEDYQNWGADDSYLENWVMNKLSLTKAPI